MHKKTFIIVKNTPVLRFISFQATRCCANAKIVNKVFILSGKKYSKKEMLIEARKNTKWLRNKFKNKFKIGLENNNYYPTKAYNIVADGDFISQVVKENNLFFLFDLAHAQVTASNKNIDFNSYIKSLPMKSMLQMHICRPLLNKKKISRDTHYLPNKKMFNDVKMLADKYKNLKFFTIEYYKDTKKLIKNIQDLKKILN